jgi:hypothetical protein
MAVLYIQLDREGSASRGFDYIRQFVERGRAPCGDNY